MTELMSPLARKPFLVQIRENLLLGLLTLTPLAVTLWVLISVIRFMDRAIFEIIPERVEPAHILGYELPGLGIVLTFFLLLGAGILARTFAGKLFQSASDSLILRVPVVGSLYKMAKQMSTVFFSKDTSAAFQHVVYVPFPSSSSRALAFVTGAFSDSETMVYVPTAPNPTSGYVLIYKNTELTHTDLHVDDALKIILSCGAVTKS